ncbi:hypothetical protein [Caballeronia zhejiangensis]|uniref:hypothetical protein n=1 Tax=Caballeronia zhejiangensis TaxID=871203 RepID=UPI001FD02D1A|nr:hypothetical protein [Caballeronia zhejiangensis]
MQRKPPIVDVGFHVETDPVAMPLPPRPRVIHQQAMSSIPAGPAKFVNLLPTVGWSALRGYAYRPDRWHSDLNHQRKIARF